MAICKNKFILGFLIFVLSTGILLGAVVWHYGSIYERQAAVYTKTLDWVVPMSIKYVRMSMDEETGMFYGLSKESKDTINAKGEIVKSQKLTEDNFEPESLGYGFITFEENHSVGAKDEKGNIIIPAEHQFILPFEDGYCIALKKDGDDVIYDKHGKLLKDGCSNLRYLTNDKFISKLDNGYEIFDLHTGKTWNSYKDREFNDVFLLDEHTLAIGFSSQSSGFQVTDYVLFNEQLQPLMNEKTFTVVGGLSEGMRYFISSDTTFDGSPAKVEAGFMNAYGETVFLFDHVPDCVNDYKDGLAIVYDDQFYVLDKEGKRVFSKEYTGNAIVALRSNMVETYDISNGYFVQFQEGVAPFTLDGKNWGYIDKKGKIIIEPVFKKASPVCQGYAVVCGTGAIGPSSVINSRWGILDLREVLKDVQ